MIYRTQLNILRYSLRQPVRNICAGCGVRYGRDDTINGGSFPDKYYSLNVEKVTFIQHFLYTTHPLDLIIIFVILTINEITGKIVR